MNRKRLIPLLIFFTITILVIGLSLRLQPGQSQLGIFLIIGAALIGTAAVISGLNDLFDLSDKIQSWFGKNAPSELSTPPSPTPQSGGINIGNLTSSQNTDIDLNEVAGRDLIKITNIANTYIQAGKLPPTFHGVPSLPNHFLGRDNLISQLVSQLTAGASLALSAEGLPGVGKTTLAVALAYHRDILTHFTDGVLWAGLGQVPDVMTALAQWAEALGDDVTRLATPQERHRAVQNLIGQKRLLLIIDDAWELEPAQQLRCGGPHCVHLLTTRDKGIARNFAGPHHLTAVPPLDDDPAFLLLQTLAPRACAVDPTTARQLALAVGGLPLALELLGGYLADPNAPERLHFPQASQAALADLTVPAQRLQLARQRLGSHDGPITLQATIELSLTDLPDATRHAFYALGAFVPKPATFSQSAALAVTAATLRELALLLDRNLLEPTNQQLTLHQTLADVAVAHLPPTASTRHWDYYLAQVNTDPEDWQHIQTLYEQLQWAWQHAPDTPDILELIWALHLYQERRGTYSDTLTWSNRGLAICRAQGLRQEEGTLLNNIGAAHHALGQHQAALDNYERALSIRKEVGDRAGQATTFNNTGATHRALGQYQAALVNYEWALSIRKEVGDRAGQAITLNNIGLVHRALGQHQTALGYYRQALPIYEEVGDRAGQATTLNNIGAVYDALGQRQTALDYYQQALPICEEVGDRSREAVTRYNMAMVYRDQGDLAGAIAQLRQVVTLDRLVQHPDLEADTAILAKLEAELAQQQP